MLERKHFADVKDVQRLIRILEGLESRCTINWFAEKVSYNVPVNFEESLTTHRHRWFPYKEGFSPSFVRQFIKSQINHNQGVVLDPFAGVGTTLVECSLNGIESLGYDTNPLAVFVSNTKLQKYGNTDRKELQRALDKFTLSALATHSEPTKNDTVLSYFSPSVIQNILAIKSFYQKIGNPKVADLFRLALLANLENMSTHRKAGNGVKRKAISKLLETSKYENKEIARKCIAETVGQYQIDISSSELKADSKIILANSLEAEFPLHQGGLSGVLTSPPYANCFDYSKIYLSELWIGDFFSNEKSQQQFRMNSVRSHVHATWPERNVNSGSEIIDEFVFPVLTELELWSSKIGQMIRGYFRDLGKLLDNLVPYLDSYAPVGLVVGNSIYGGMPIATDLIIAELGRKYGYVVDSINVYRKIIPSSQQYLNYVNCNQIEHYSRESLVILRKNREKASGLENVYTHSTLTDGQEVSFPSTRRYRQYTHKIMNRYPARSISLVPRAILKDLNETKPQQQSRVLDPFMGSGTTAVETRLIAMTPYGVEIDPFARMVSDVKTYAPTETEISRIHKLYRHFESNWHLTLPDYKYAPDLYNINYWFDELQYEHLLQLTTTIMNETNQDSYENKFFRVVLADIIRPCSKAERQTLKPYISKAHKKIPANVSEAFTKCCRIYIGAIEEFKAIVKENEPITWIGSDATNFRKMDYAVDVAISSPPYLNALDYIRCIKLESAWSQCSTGLELQQLRQYHVGEAVRKPSKLPPAVAVETAEYANRISIMDATRGKIVLQYFTDMFNNMRCVYNVLKPGGFYHLIVGDSVIRNVEIPTHQILGRLAEHLGFNLSGYYYYRIKDHRTSIPRKGNGGKIDIEYVVSLQKE